MKNDSSSRLTEAGQSVVEYALILLLIGIVILAILLILGNDLRAFVFDLLRTWFPERESLIPLLFS
ncbi:MAG: hypothetical protein D6775_14890 [Caldilineae bacterium]|nr:MAG: hypothetical protein D6775_14890 [Caldilineae bacterium]